MKNTIDGFSQSYALSLRKETIKRGKAIEKKMDCTDLAILRWFVDFYPSMAKVTIGGKEYAWVYYQKIIDDLPIIDISKRALAERLQKMTEFGILEYKMAREVNGKAGTYTTYGFGENYMNLVDDGGCCSNSRGVCCSNGKGDDAQTATEYQSLENKSSKKIEDKKDRTDKRAWPHPLTDRLIESGYVREDDPEIDEYDEWFRNASFEGCDYKTLRSATWYLIDHFKATKGKDEMGNPIRDRLSYLKTSIRTGARRLKEEEGNTL